MSVQTETTNRYALKEWAVVVDALDRGRQIVLLRKGGIKEPLGDFTVEHRQFFLYPTYFHEQRGRVIPEAAAALDTLEPAAPPEDRLVLRDYAVVDATLLVTDFRQLERLQPHHILTLAEMDQRFNYRGTLGLHVVLLRVYRLPHPMTLPAPAAYAGCTSWVTLDVAVSTAGCTPVLDDAAFARAAGAIRGVLAAS